VKEISMQSRLRGKSTNVRFYLDRETMPAAIALVLWIGFAEFLGASGALAALGADVPWIAAFACAVAALAYAVDGELRHALSNARPAVLLAGAAAAIALTLSHAAGLVAFSPAAVLFGAALLLRPRARPVSSAAAASPGARRGAL
jgi:hypothetical protein